VRIATLDPLPGTARTPSLGLLQGRNQRARCLSHRQACRGTTQVRYAVASSTTRPDTAGARGDPLYHIRLLLRASRDRLTKRQQERLHAAFTADEAHISVEAACHCAQQVREVFPKPHPPTANAWSLVSLSAYQRVPSPKSPDWAGPYASGRMPSWPTSTQADPATAPPKPSTESSNEADAPPEATATPPTTSSECSSSQAA